MIDILDKSQICGLCDKRKGKTVRHNDIEFTCCSSCAEQFSPDKLLAHAILICHKRGTLRRIAQ